ncbi:hypothetical protein CHS0354_041527, partial [Potamilus streckersoni]
RNPPPENICPSGLRTTPKLTSAAREILTTWFKKNKEHPYPAKIDMTLMAMRARITLKQVKTWFANARRRQKGRKQNATNGERQKYLSCVNQTVVSGPNTDDHVKSKLSQIYEKQIADSDYSRTLKSSRPEPKLSTSESIRALQQCCDNVGADPSKESCIGSVTSEEPSFRNFSNTSLVKDNGAPPVIASPDVGDVTGIASLPSPLSAISPVTPSTQQFFRPYHEGQHCRHGSSAQQLGQNSVCGQQSLGNFFNMRSPSTDYGIYNNGNNVQCVPSYAIQDQWHSREYWWHSYTGAYPTRSYYLPCSSPLGGNGLFERNNAVDFRRNYNKPAQIYGESLVDDNMMDVPFFPSLHVLEPVKISEDPFPSTGIQRTLISMKVRVYAIFCTNI